MQEWSYEAIARRCLNNSDIRKYVVHGIGRILRQEIAALCSDKVKSILRDKSNTALKAFKWKQLEDEMITHSPTLLSILRSCTTVPRSNLQQQGLIGVITAILCKNRRGSASLVQRLISVILYGGHASKKVSIRCSRLQQ
jgi:hypothetical protein